MIRRLEELDRIDELHGLGASPLHAPPRTPRRHRGPVIPGLVIALVVPTLLFLFSPGQNGYRFRQLLHIGDTVTSSSGPGAFNILQRQPDGTPVSYDPCHPIHYVVNTDGAPDNYRNLVAGAVQRIHRATGFDFEYDGSTGDRDFDRSSVSSLSAPVLIGWASTQERPELAGTVVGIGGSSSIQSDGRRVYVTGMVALDRDAFADLDAAGEDAVAEAVVMHELGHVVGLGHVKDRDELMFAQNTGQTDFGPGDLRGLAELGAVPCS